MEVRFKSIDKDVHLDFQHCYCMSLHHTADEFWPNEIVCEPVDNEKEAFIA